MILSELAA